MASIFTVPALITNQGLAATLKTVCCCALVQYQVGITYKALYQRIVLFVLLTFCSLSLYVSCFFYIKQESSVPRHDSHSYIIFGVLEMRELSLISNDDLFLCESGDEIRSLGDRCNIHPNCGDRSDERNCDQCKLFWSEHFYVMLQERKMDTLVWLWNTLWAEPLLSSFCTDSICTVGKGSACRVIFKMLKLETLN